MLPALEQGLSWFMCTPQHVSKIGASSLKVPALFTGLIAWYAERFPAMRSGIAVEHLAACRVQAQQQGQAAYPSSSRSLWMVLQELHSSLVDGAGVADVQTASSGLDQDTEADEFAALSSAECDVC